MYEELKEMLNKELKEVVRKGELSAGSLDVIDKLTHSLKSLKALEGGSSYDSYGRGSYEGSYARRGRDGDGDGRYSEDSFRYSQDRGRSSYGSYGYSRDAATDAMKQKLRTMMEEPISEDARLALMDCLNKIK